MALLSTDTDLQALRLLAKGKVRDVYETSRLDTLLFVASDRVSAYDVILRNGIPDKGKLLTEISLFWFEKLAHIVPNHLITANVDEMPEEVRQYKSQLQGRAMLVRKAKVLPIEAIVRGYITGSAWEEYERAGTVHGTPLPKGLQECEKLPKPLFTPSTKAEQGQHDENISQEQAAKLVGEELFAQISSISLELYSTAAAYAIERGLILADTKFEFGLIASTSNPDKEELILIDEVLTMDSSRYWPLDSYAVGHSQPSFDKQYLRDWLRSVGFRKGLESGPEGKEGGGWEIDEAVVNGTRERYVEAVRQLKR